MIKIVEIIDSFSIDELTQRVSNKSKSIVMNINAVYFTDYEYDVRVSPYSTLLIDWFDDDKNELSLEIGKDYLGYYCDGKVVKEVDSIDITTVDKILLAVSIIENDISLSVFKK
jgi:hypothetical protein